MPIRCLLIALTGLLLGCPATSDPFIRVCFMDWDGDGFGHSETFDGGDACGDDQGEVTNGSDCNDADPDVHPGAEETAGDWLDQDCNGIDAVLCRTDADQDGYGAEPVVVQADGDCDEAGLQPVWQFADCDDTDADIHPFALDPIGDGVDQDCSLSDVVTCFVDEDGDGFGATWLSADPEYPCDGLGEASVGEDCDDSDPSVNPEAVEVPNDFIDQNCDGHEELTCRPDEDGDGYGDAEATPIPTPDGDCSDPVLADDFGPGDCDDADPSAHPGAWDTPDDGIDQDCDGVDGTAPGPAGTCFVDEDGDGFGSLAVEHDDCGDPGFSALAGDCDDDDDERHPGATEVIGDGVDQNCDGQELYACYEDGDGDGYGGPVMVGVADGNCPAHGLAWGSTDCHDGDPAISPAAYDVPGDGLDQDCNLVDSVLCYYDGDYDGFGWGWPNTDPDGDCADPFQSPSDGDCNDWDFSVHPGATDTPDDGVDQDCSGADTALCFEDDDGDGFGGAIAVEDPDGDCVDAGQAGADDDCDDADFGVHPGAGEIAADGVDQDCDGIDAAWCYADHDNDGYGAGPGYIDADGICSATGQSDNDQDCNNTNSAIYPGAVETASDDIDSDCDGQDDP